MVLANITVTSVIDEGDQVIVWGRTEDAPADSDPIGFVFLAKGEGSDVELAVRASRLEPGTPVVIDHMAATEQWKVARGLS